MTGTPLQERARAALAERYALEREVGSGGSASVFLARDRKHERPVAVKVLRPALAAEVGAARFLREIRIAAGFNHPHILPLLDSGEADGLLYYVMPYAPAGSLRRRMANGPLPPDDALRIAGQVAAALDYAHGRGVLHRDVKPENVLFSGGLALVSDFGLARAMDADGPGTLTRTGLGVGTPGYMSPEQALGGADVDRRTDVYGLACVAYEMLVGGPPRVWSTEESVRLGRLVDVRGEDRDRLDRLPGRIEQVLARALAIRSADRYGEAGLFAAALVAATEPHGRLDEDSVRAVLRRAAELEAAEPEPPGTLSLGSVERIAAQVDIPARYVRAAARELGLEDREIPLPGPAAERDPTQPSRAAAPGSPGSPVASVAPLRRSALRALAPGDRAMEQYDDRARHITVGRRVPRAVPEGDYPALAAALRETLGGRGRATVVDGGLVWSADGTGDVARRVVVRLSPEGPGTGVRLDEQLELTDAKLLAAPFGAAGGALVGLVLGSVWPLGPLVLMLMVGCAIVGGILGADRAYWVEARARVPELEVLADVVAELVEGFVAGPRAPGSQGSGDTPGGAP